MTVTICVRDTAQKIPSDDASRLAQELRLYAAGYRGEVDDPGDALALADAIDSRLSGQETGAIDVDAPAALDALHRVLNAIVHELGPAMQLYNAVDAARRAA
jgi:hypothetical protein